VTDRRLAHLAEVRFSSIDKKTVDGQVRVQLCNYVDVYYNEYIGPGLEFMEASATLEQVRDFELKQGDVLLTKDSETAEDIGVSACVRMNLPGVVSGYHLALIRPRSDVDGRYLRWALSSRGCRSQLEVAATGVTRFGLRQEAVAALAVPSWPLALQRSIADYLDVETARIDALVGTRSAQRALVQARHLSMLSSLLVPEGVAFGPLKRLAAIQSGLTVDALRDSGDDPVTRPYLRVANVQLGRLELDSVTEITVPRGLATRCTLRAGDVLMTEGGDLDKLGRGTVWRDELPGALHQNHIFAVRPLPDRLDPDYLGLLTQTAHARAYFESTGVRTTNLASTNSEKIMSLPVPRLDLGDQRKLVAEARTRLDQLASFEECLRRQADLLLERRQALITAAVTGQLEIPGVAA
jgi:type I restriction enzyme, S subunit